MIAATLGTVLSGLGVACLYTSWRRRHRAVLVWSGWLLLAASLYCWILGSGAELGVSFALICLSLLGWLAVFINFEIRQQKSKDKVTGQLMAPSAKTLSRHLLLFVVAVPLSGAAAMLASAALTLALPWQPVNEMVFAVLLMPVLWGLASYWACADEKIIRPLLALTACAGVSALLLYV